MTNSKIESRPTSPLTWIALAVGFMSLIYVPMLFGRGSSDLLVKLGLFRAIPFAAAIAFIYSISVAVLDKKVGETVSGPILATIIVSGFGTLADLVAILIAFSHGGAGP